MSKIIQPTDSRIPKALALVKNTDIKGAVEAGPKGNENFLELISDIPIRSATSYDMILIIIAFYNYCKFSKDLKLQSIGQKTEKSSSEIYKLLTNLDPNSSNMLKFRKHFMKVAQIENHKEALSFCSNINYIKFNAEDLNDKHIEILDSLILSLTGTHITKPKTELDDFVVIKKSTQDLLVAAIKDAKAKNSTAPLKELIKNEQLDLNKPLPSSNLTPLKIALDFRDINIIMFFIENGAYALPNNETPLFYVLTQPNPNINILKELASEPNVELTLHHNSLNEESVFHWAIENKHEEILYELIPLLQKRNKERLMASTNKEGYALFHLAVKYKNTNLMSFLNKLDFPPNTVNLDNITAIQTAIDFNDPSFLQEFLNLKDVNINMDTPTPLIYALSNKSVNIEVINCLIIKGSNLLSKDENDNNILHLLLQLKNLTPNNLQPLLSTIYLKLTPSEVNRLPLAENKSGLTPLDIANKTNKDFSEIINSIIYDI